MENSNRVIKFKARDKEKNKVGMKTEKHLERDYIKLAILVMESLVDTKIKELVLKELFSSKIIIKDDLVDM